MKAKHLIKKISVFITAVFIISNLSGCSSSKSLMSSWQNKEIKIDGNPAEWLPVMQQIPDKKVSVGFKNDSKFLYLCFMTEDRAKIYQIMRNGFVVWYETESNEYKTYGVRYPLPINFSEQKSMGKEGEQRQGGEREKAAGNDMGAGLGEQAEGGKDLGQRENLDKFFQNFFQKQNEIEVIDKDRFPLTALSLPNKEGTEAKFGTWKGMLVYELKVPLAVGGDYSFSAGAVPGDNLKVRFETETLSARSMGEQGESGGQRGQRPGGGMGGGMRGGGMRGGGMRGGGMGGGSSSGNGSIDFTVEIKLTAQPAKQ